MCTLVSNTKYLRETKSSPKQSTLPNDNWQSIQNRYLYLPDQVFLHVKLLPEHWQGSGKFGLIWPAPGMHFGQCLQGFQSEQSSLPISFCVIGEGYVFGWEIIAFLQDIWQRFGKFGLFWSASGLHFDQFLYGFQVYQSSLPISFGVLGEGYCTSVLWMVNIKVLKFKLEWHRFMNDH